MWGGADKISQVPRIVELWRQRAELHSRREMSFRDGRELLSMLGRAAPRTPGARIMQSEVPRPPSTGKMPRLAPVMLFSHGDFYLVSTCAFRCLQSSEAPRL
jgi:hypothetical protein